MSSFSLKSLRIVIRNQQTGLSRAIEGLACQVSIRKPGLPDKNKASLRIWGLPYADMDQLTMLSFKPLELQDNKIEILAGEQDGALALAFQGEISGAWADFNCAPDPVMRIEACSGQFSQLIPLPPVTTHGEAPAAKLFAQFAAEAGYAFQNEGVSASVNNAWFFGSPLDKALKLARDVGCELILDDNVLICLPPDRPRPSNNPVELGPNSGLIGYPTFSQDGISCRCLYNPDLAYGALVRINSIVPKASGLWQITNLCHDLSAYKADGGTWESRVEAAYYG